MTRSVPKVQWPTNSAEVERLNDQLAREHSIDDYYARSPWVIRWVQEQRLRVIRDMVGSRPGLRILEVGCGGGHVLRMFSEAKLTAVDVSDVFLETARKNLAGCDVEFIKGQIEQLALPAASFDRVICTEVLEHTTNPEQVIHAIRRLLVADGRAVITVPIDPVIDRAKRILKMTPAGWLLGNRIQWGGDHYHLQKWWPWQFQRLLERDFIVDRRKLVPTLPVPLHACFCCRPGPSS
jgi:2-polyprenyl-3-methyl-5-hydroxy-6-metoxy-1,4-benzoquinol methylase